MSKRSTKTYEQDGHLLFLIYCSSHYSTILKVELHRNTHNFSNSPNGLNKWGQLTEVPPELIGHLQQAYITPLQAVNTKQTKFPPFPLFEGIYVSCIAFYF